MSEKQTFTGNRGLQLEEPLIFEIGSFEIFNTLRILSSLKSICFASSSGVGSRPVSCVI